MTSCRKIVDICWARSFEIKPTKSRNAGTYIRFLHYVQQGCQANICQTSLFISDRKVRANWGEFFEIAFILLSFLYSDIVYKDSFSFFESYTSLFVICRTNLEFKYSLFEKLLNQILFLFYFNILYVEILKQVYKNKHLLSKLI